MKCIMKARPERGLAWSEQPRPEIGPEDVLVKVAKTGLCGTDLHIYEWDEWARGAVPTPIVVGHEYAGVVVEVGERAKGVRVGMRASGEGHVVGFKSRASRAGHFHLDPETRGIGVNLPGAFAEFVRVPAFNIVPLPDSVDDEIGAVLDPLGNAVHTALAYDLVGEDVLITGAGPIGIMAAAVARRAGARHVVITDVDPGRLALAGRVADVTPVDARNEDLRDAMAKLGMREGFDVGLEMSGAGAAITQMIDNMVMGGRIALLGIPPKSLAIDWTKVVFRMLTIKGIYGREMFETWYKMLALLESGLDVRGVITHRLPARDFEAGFAAMRAGGSGKVVLDWGGDLG